MPAETVPSPGSPEDGAAASTIKQVTKTIWRMEPRSIPRREDPGRSIVVPSPGSRGTVTSRAMGSLNKQWLLASRPQGPAEESNFRLVEQEVPALRDGELLVRVHYLSLDPYMRGRMD